jgi:hypothetical protein
MYNLQKSRENIDKHLPVYVHRPVSYNREGTEAIPESLSSSPPSSPSSSYDSDYSVEDSDDDLSLQSHSQPQPENGYLYENKYYYLKNEKYLQTDFEAATILPDYNMQMCIYKCVRQGCTPFLMYLLQYHEGKYILPSRREPNGEVASTSEESSTTEETDIMEKFHEYLFNIFPPNEIQKLNTEDPADLYDPELFKGFYNHKTSNKLTMVYDATRIQIPISTEPTLYVWATPYEMFISKNIKEIPIDETVRESFIEIGDNEKDFHHLYTENDTIIKSPFVLYLCKTGDAPSGFNLFTKPDIDATITNDYNTDYSVIYPRIQHPLLGDYTFFSNKMLNPDAAGAEGTADKLRRFAVFVDIPGLHPLYVEQDETDKLNHLYDIDQTEQYSSITYLRSSDKAQLWCVKSSQYFSEIQ